MSYKIGEIVDIPGIGKCFAVLDVFLCGHDRFHPNLRTALSSGD